MTLSRSAQATTRVLVTGVPRSGTTWVGRILAAGLGLHQVEEPDNHFVVPYAFRAKRRLAQGDYPRPGPDDDVGDYELLWQAAFTPPARRGRPRLARVRRGMGRYLLQRERARRVSLALTGAARPTAGLRAAELLADPEQPPAAATAVVAKSVHAALALDWISAVCAPSVVVVLRNPLNVVSSWLEMNWLEDDVVETLGGSFREELARRYEVPVPEADASGIARAAWLAGALTAALAEAGVRAGGQTFVTHEELCRAPHDRFRELARELQLTWQPEGDRLLEALNRPGRGYETARVAADLESVWRSRVTPEDAREAEAVLRLFPLEPWY